MKDGLIKALDIINEHLDKAKQEMLNAVKSVCFGSCFAKSLESYG